MRYVCAHCGRPREQDGKSCEGCASTELKDLNLDPHSTNSGDRYDELTLKLWQAVQYPSLHSPRSWGDTQPFSLKDSEQLEEGESHTVSLQTATLVAIGVFILVGLIALSIGVFLQ